MRSGSAAPGKSTVFSGKMGTVCARRPSENTLRMSKAALVPQVAMPQHHGIVRCEALGELVGDVHRPMAPARAADRDGERGALVEDEAREPALQEPLDVLDEDAGLGLALEEGDDLRVVAGERPKARVVVRIREHAARVEDEV